MTAKATSRLIGALAFSATVAAATVAMAQSMPPYAQPAPTYTGAETGTSYVPPAPAPGARYQGDTFAPIVDLNLRAGPSDDAPVLAVLPQGMPVRVTASTPAGWFQVETGHGTGWAYSRYLAPG